MTVAMTIPSDLGPCPCPGAPATDFHPPPKHRDPPKVWGLLREDAEDAVSTVVSPLQAELIVTNIQKNEQESVPCTSAGFKERKGVSMVKVFTR